MDWVQRGKPVDIKYFLESIASGIKHMHSIGLVPCDIKPDNILLDDTGRRHEYGAGDFDSTAQAGTVYGLKGGDRNWSKPKRMIRIGWENDKDRVEESDAGMLSNRQRSG